MLTDQSLDELQALPSSSVDTSLSPDIGPPPVAHFEPDDPAQLPEVQLNPRNDTTAIDDTQSFRDIVPANLESRRRKRESINPEEIRRASMFSKSPKNDAHKNDSTKEDVPNSRTSMKRKFDASETVENLKTSAPEGLASGRKSSTSRSQQLSSVVVGNGTARKPTEEISISRSKPREKSKESVLRRDHPDRKALAPSKSLVEAVCILLILRREYKSGISS